MSFFGICGACKKRKLWVAKRKIKIPNVKDPVISKSKLCNKCITNIKKLSGI